MRNNKRPSSAIPAPFNEQSGDMLVELQGQIERITYTNEENGFTIARVKVPGRHDLVCVVGNMMAPMPGEIIRMQGEWASHPKFGEQFKVDGSTVVDRHSGEACPRRL
jgi:hypothetical protein